MAAGRSDTAGASWSVQLRTAPSSGQLARPPSWAHSRLSCPSPGPLAVVAVERAQPSTSCHVSAPAAPPEWGHTPLLAHPGDLCRPHLGLGSPQLSIAPICERLPNPAPLHLLSPGLSAGALGATLSVDWDWDNCSWLSGCSESRSQCPPPRPLPHPLQYTCPLFVLTAGGMGVAGEPTSTLMAAFVDIGGRSGLPGACPLHVQACL